MEHMRRNDTASTSQSGRYVFDAIRRSNTATTSQRIRSFFDSREQSDTASTSQRIRSFFDRMRRNDTASTSKDVKSNLDMMRVLSIKQLNAAHDHIENRITDSNQKGVLSKVKELWSQEIYREYTSKEKRSEDHRAILLRAQQLVRNAYSDTSRYGQHLELVDKLHNEISRQQTEFDQFMQARSTKPGIDISTEDRHRLQEVYIDGLNIERRAADAPREPLEKIQESVDRVYEHSISGFPGGEFTSTLKVRDTGKEAHINRIDTTDGVFYGEFNEKAPGGPSFSDVKLYVKNAVEQHIGSSITIHQYIGESLINQDTIRMASIVSDGQYSKKCVAGSVEFTILMGTREAKSNAFFADQLGRKISSIEVVGASQGAMMMDQMLYEFVPKINVIANFASI